MVEYVCEEISLTKLRTVRRIFGTNQPGFLGDRLVGKPSG